MNLASGGGDPIQQQGEEASKLNELFSLLGAKPKTDNKEELHQWIIQYAASLKAAEQSSSTEQPVDVKPSVTVLNSVATSGNAAPTTPPPGGHGLVSSA